MYETIIFILGSFFLIIVSRKSLFKPKSHGFYRFLSWEIMLGMLVVNVDGWFKNPFAWYQLISWILLISSIVLVVLGIRLLRQIGIQESARKETELLEWEKTSKLVTVGLYHYIRHPMYSSLLFLAWGIYFKSPSWLDTGLIVLCTIFLTATARVEEHENIEFFGTEYVEYMKRTKMFIPFLF